MSSMPSRMTLASTPRPTPRFDPTASARRRSPPSCRDRCPTHASRACCTTSGCSRSRSASPTNWRAPSTPRVLCVDDEQYVLDALTRTLRSDFDVDDALGGAAALEMLEHEPPYAVVVSDMRMPGMDGTTFLARASEVAPDSVRVLLTGHA